MNYHYPQGTKLVSISLREDTVCYMQSQGMANLRDANILLRFLLHDIYNGKITTTSHPGLWAKRGNVKTVATKIRLDTSVYNALKLTGLNVSRAINAAIMLYWNDFKNNGTPYVNSSVIIKIVKNQNKDTGNVCLDNQASNTGNPTPRS